MTACRQVEMPGEFPTLRYLVQDWIEEHAQPVQLYDEQVLHLLHRYRLGPETTAGGDA